MTRLKLPAPVEVVGRIAEIGVGDKRSKRFTTALALEQIGRRPLVFLIKRGDPFTEAQLRLLIGATCRVTGTRDGRYFAVTDVVVLPPLPEPLPEPAPTPEPVLESYEYS